MDESGSISERRVDTRYPLDPAYTEIGVKLHPNVVHEMKGHAYDISRSGICFELDSPLEIGTPIMMRVALPEWLSGLIPTGEEDLGGITVRGKIVWNDDDGVPGPVRMAATFTSFDSQQEHELLLATLIDARQTLSAA